MATTSPSRISIITVLGFLVIIFLASQMVIERYGLVDRRNVMLARLITSAFMVNIGILIFMILSYNNVEGNPGTPGPKGVRGSRGMAGNNDSISMCPTSSPTSSQPNPTRTLGTLRTRQQKRQI